MCHLGPNINKVFAYLQSHTKLFLLGKTTSDFTVLMTPLLCLINKLYKQLLLLPLDTVGIMINRFHDQRLLKSTQARGFYDKLD